MHQPVDTLDLSLKCPPVGKVFDDFPTSKSTLAVKSRFCESSPYVDQVEGLLRYSHVDLHVLGSKLVTDNVKKLLF